MNNASDPLLELYADYDREGVKNIFDPDAAFTPGAGKWGLQGLVELAGEPGSYVFFVSFGRTQGEHEFDEGINQTGFLRWQSQPKQDLTDRRIQEWIQHNSDVNAIHLFLRTALRRDGVPAPYTYLGELEYAGHDPEREKPVHFSWRLKCWPIPDLVQERIQLKVEGEDALKWEVHSPSVAAGAVAEGLAQQPAPEPRGEKKQTPEKKRTFTPRLDINFEGKSARARKIGDLGERLVVGFEKDRLEACNREDLAKKVVHVAKERGDGAGYDVLSYFEDGREMFIEVKTTTSGPRTDFLISANEIAFASEYADQYRLYRLYNLDEKGKAADFFVLDGDIQSQFDAVPTEYRVTGF